MPWHGQHGQHGQHEQHGQPRLLSHPLVARRGYTSMITDAASLKAMPSTKGLWINSLLWMLCIRLEMWYLFLMAHAMFAKCLQHIERRTTGIAIHSCTRSTNQFPLKWNLLTKNLTLFLSLGVLAWLSSAPAAVQWRSIAKWHWSGHDFGCLSELTPASFLEDEIFGLLEFLAAAFSSPKRTPSPQRNTVLLKDGSCPRPTTAGA